ncbi:hypothetical protein QAD02_005775 [Eretmocerus hayati]|uniref:Uncharacterized protein n=1 Tax=Eretmocerus hayati TaxID=131215 RepID=A0ACC2NTH8_9HYME|nr:hypothetical protein QAD02_005775 [Eretmocerus hayati]
MNATAAEDPADKAKADALYENREPKKILRIITVTAYMISVSFVGIVLSAYYIFLWHPPNPRLMHAMAQEGHHERLVSGPEMGSQEAPAPILRNLASMAQPSFSEHVDDRVISLLGDRLDEETETVKRRRQIIDNVNSFLSANFEKSQVIGMKGEETTVSSLLPDTTVESLESTSTVFEQLPERNEETTTPMLPPQLFPSTKRIRNSAKKQQQMPFALKHLEVPIQSDRLRKRSARISTSSGALTIGNENVPPDSDEAPLDKASAPSESDSNTPAYAAVIGEQSNEPRQLGVMGLLKKLSSQPDHPPRQQKPVIKNHLPKEPISESPILNRLHDYDEAGTTEIPDLVDD